MSISLIANSGLQFHKFETAIDLNNPAIRSSAFYEKVNFETEEVTLEYAYHLPSEDVYVSKTALDQAGYIDSYGRPKDTINPEVVQGLALKENIEYFTIGNIESCLDLYASNNERRLWIPIPYLRRDNLSGGSFGPTAWARMMLFELPQKDSKLKSYRVILLFDTTITDDAGNLTPTSGDLTEVENIFSVGEDEDQLLHFISTSYHCEWVERYLQKITKRDKKSTSFPFLKNLGQYIYLIKYLKECKCFPDVILYTDQRTPIDVDLVLDIGNSNTCGILFENAQDKGHFNFNSVKRLKLQDLSSPELDYENPFSMRLAFVEPRFGDIIIPQRKMFQWPSLVRLGAEASRLINQYNIDTDRGRETNTHHSSPKRYLWDTKEAGTPWQFVNFKGSSVSESIYMEGLSEQFKANGEYAHDGKFACLPTYSRKSLMTFVYMEIILNAISQVNSHEFRYAHGSIDRPRRLRRVTITCPTSIIQKEQVVLRECAVDATKALNRYFGGHFIASSDQKQSSDLLEVIPKPKDLGRIMTEAALKKDWIYDEATCCQLVFLYAEISQRFLNKADLFINLYGKYRNDVSRQDQKSITIASFDIGGGTSDLMICAYQHEKGQGQAVLKPHPLFWESFNLAGDDLLKEVIHQILIEGNVTGTNDRGAIGVFENAARDAGVNDVRGKLNRFFAPNSNTHDYIHQIFRKNFVIQVAIPIAERYIRHAIEGGQDQYVSFSDIFSDKMPNQQVLDYFNNHFAPMRIQDIQWKLSVSRLNSVLENTFDSMFKQVSAIVSAYGADYLLLAGRPTTIPRIRELFMKYYPVSPDRLLTLNEYRVGRWYPFSTPIGYFDDPKTIVSVGAIIALMGGRLENLNGFRLNTELLKLNLVNTSDFIGILHQDTQQIEPLLFSPDTNQAILDVHAFPVFLGYKQLPSDSYRSRPLYKVDINEAYFRQKVLDQHPEGIKEKELAEEINKLRTTLIARMPFKLTLKRDWINSKEVIKIDSGIDRLMNDISHQQIALQYMTLPNEKGYWLDTGEFMLGIN